MLRLIALFCAACVVAGCSSSSPSRGGSSATGTSSSAASTSTSAASGGSSASSTGASSSAASSTSSSSASSGTSAASSSSGASSSSTSAASSGSTGASGSSGSAGSSGSSGSTGAGCVINGSSYAAGEANPSDDCERCDPAQSTSQWSSLADGSACGASPTTSICYVGVCRTACYIAGSFYDTGVVNSQNLCEHCDPTQSTTAWSPDDGSSCYGSGNVCHGGSCVQGCYDSSGDFTAPGSVAADDPCLVCDATSASGWSPAPVGAPCGAADAGLACDGQDHCVVGCDIDGGFFPDGQANPDNGCEVCEVGVAAASWTPSLFRPFEPSGVSWSGPVAVGDLDGDGRGDLASAFFAINDAGLMVTLTLPDGGFGAATLYPMSWPYAVAAGDLDGDGRADLVLALPGGVQVLYAGDGGALANGPSWTTGVNLTPGVVRVADLDGDGRLDFAVMLAYPTPDGFDVRGYLNQGDGGFSAGASVHEGYVTSDFALADFDRDGKLDVGFAIDSPFGNSYDVGLDVAFSGGGQLWTLGSSLTLTSLPDLVRAGDIDGDGIPDVLLGDKADDMVTVALAEPDGGFFESGAYPSGTGMVGIELADVNGDGAPDILVSNQGGSAGGRGLVVMLNQSAPGAPAFGPPLFFAAPSAGQLASGDLNGDGRRDVALSTGAFLACP